MKQSTGVKALLLFFLCGVMLLAQGPRPLMVISVFDIRSTATVIDNRSQTDRRADYHGFCVTAIDPTYTVQLQYSDVSRNGPWTNFADSTSLVTQANANCYGYGLGYHPFIRFQITGNVSVNYTGTKLFYHPYGRGGGDSTTASNLGSGAGLFSSKVASDLRFRSLLAGSNRIGITQNSNDVTLDINALNILLNTLGGSLNLGQINLAGGQVGECIKILSPGVLGWGSCSGGDTPAGKTWAQLTTFTWSSITTTTWSQLQ